MISNTVISNVNKSDQLCSCGVHADLADCNRPWFAKLKACDLEKGIYKSCKNGRPKWSKIDASKSTSGHCYMRMLSLVAGKK